MTTRRTFLKVGAASVAGGTLLRGLAHSAGAAALERPAAPMRILILGGTGFVGPHLVRHAAARGHKVTIFTRGRHDAELPDSIERLTGDRNGQLDSLRNKTWDAVVDDSATNPDW